MMSPPYCMCPEGARGGGGLEENEKVDRCSRQTSLQEEKDEGDNQFCWQCCQVLY